MNAADIKIDSDASFLLVGDGGTHKTWFIGTCPQPSYTFDLDKGFSIHRGRADMDYDTFMELPRGEKLAAKGVLKDQGWYEWGTAYPAVIAKMNELGRAIDNGTCKYATIGVDSLTMLTQVVQSYILRENNRTQMEMRDWGAFLSNMTQLFSQFRGWPVVKVLTSHVKRDENPLTQSIEKLPLVPGQFGGVVPTLFDEVYYTEGKVEGNPKVQRWVIRTLSDGMNRQAKSRKYNIPDGTTADFNAVLAHIKALGAK